MNNVKLVCFDMNDTLISQNSWYKLNLALGVTAYEDQEMYDAYGRGDLTYGEWMERLLELYKERGLATIENISRVLSEFEFNSGAVDLVNDLKNKGYELALISGSFEVLVNQVADTLKIGMRKGNTDFVFSNENYLEGVKSGGDELYAKLGHLKTFCANLGISIKECACIGDGANDIELFKATGLGITFDSAPEQVKENAWRVVSDLSQIKEIL